MRNSKPYAAWAIAISTIVLSACGGGDGDTTTTTETNALSSMVGTWTSGCVVDRFPEDSEQYTAVVSASSTAGAVTVSIHGQTYSGSSTCAAAQLDQEATIGGQITALSATKTIAGDPDHLKTGTAQTANFRFDSITLHNVTLTIPNFGTTSKVGYLLENGKLYGVTGTQASDDLGTRFSNVTLTKQ